MPSTMTAPTGLTEAQIAQVEFVISELRNWGGPNESDDEAQEYSADADAIQALLDAVRARQTPGPTNPGPTVQDVVDLHASVVRARRLTESEHIVVSDTRERFRWPDSAKKPHPAGNVRVLLAIIDRLTAPEGAVGIGCEKGDET